MKGIKGQLGIVTTTGRPPLTEKSQETRGLVNCRFRRITA